MLHVLLAGLHQLGQLVMPLLEQHLDVRPGLAHAMLQANQGVVEDHRVGGDQNQDHDQGNAGQTHAGFSLAAGHGLRRF
ncbi:hypothetical protein D9M68_567360 [compost metagenome]